MSKLAWFATETGKKFVFGSVGCSIAGLIGANFLPNTIFLDKYKEVIQCYRFGIENPLSQEVLNKYDAIVAELGYAQKRKLLRPFMVFGFDIYHAGTLYSKWGALIGIPTNFSYKSADQVESQDILVKQNRISWTSEDGRKLAKALVLTDDEQRYAIAREILMADTPKKILDTIYPVLSLLFCYGFASSVNTKQNLFQKPLAVRAVLYSIVGFFGLGLYFFCKDFTQVYYETSIDKQLCEFGPEMMQGGIGFYEKMLLRNIALRSLLKDNTYTALGNENYFLRHKRVPVTTRKSYFEIRYKEYMNNNQNNPEFSPVNT